MTALEGNEGGPRVLFKADVARVGASQERSTGLGVGMGKEKAEMGGPRGRDVDFLVIG